MCLLIGVGRTGRCRASTRAVVAAWPASTRLDPHIVGNIGRLTALVRLERWQWRSAPSNSGWTRSPAQTGSSRRRSTRTTALAGRPPGGVGVPRPGQAGKPIARSSYYAAKSRPSSMRAYPGGPGREDLGISPSCLKRWLAIDRKNATPSSESPQSGIESDSLRGANKRIMLLEQENEVLRRAAACLSRAHMPTRWCTRSSARWPTTGLMGPSVCDSAPVAVQLVHRSGGLAARVNQRMPSPSGKGMVGRMDPQRAQAESATPSPLQRVAARKADERRTVSAAPSRRGLTP